MMAKTWTKTETNYLSRYAATKTLSELAQRFEADKADVLKELADLGLHTKDGHPHGAVADDPMVGVYEEGLRHLYDGAWDDAISAFERVIADDDQADVAARARQMLAAAQRHKLDASGNGKDEDGDPFLRAVVARNRGDLAAALAICGEGDRMKKDDRFAYLAAAVHALAGREKEAVDALAKAVALNPENRVHAFHDPDFDHLRSQRDHAHLFGLA
jgi:tetratricopeptide (TPR) repeat protein